MSKIILASGNQHKLHEFREMFSATNIELLSQQDFAVPEAEETATTFVENALIKAHNACQYTGLPAIADDSGLEIDALNGQPGIYSARFAGEHANHAKNIEKVLEKMQGVKKEQRSARFQCVLVYLRNADDPTPIICQGTWEGKILLKKCGEHGFGYDPIFWVPDYNCSAAELDSTTKNKISHRGLAMQKMAATLLTLHIIKN